MCKEKQYNKLINIINIIIRSAIKEREEKFSLTVDWQDGRRVEVVNVFWDKFLLIWA